MTDLTISELEKRIRAFINSARKQHALLTDTAAWNQLCSSLDAVGDTELAFDAYAATAATDEAGLTYILVYGVLQALVLQQDAVRHLAEALHLFYEPDPLLLEIREVRNSSVGHPTKRRGKPLRSHFISRTTMTKHGFQLMTVYPERGPAQFTWVDLPALIATQRGQMRVILRQVVDSLQNEEDEYKSMFKDKKLASAFPATTDYCFEKLYESVHGNKPAAFGRLHVGLVREAVERFKAGIADRGATGAYDSVEYHLDLISYPIERLDGYFDSASPSPLGEREAFIFVSFIQDQVDTLRQMATEIDESYQQTGSDDA